MLSRFRTRLSFAHVTDPEKTAVVGTPGRFGAHRRGAGILGALAAAAVLMVTAGMAGGTAFAQTVEPPFDSSYSTTDLGTPPGVPPLLGGLTLRAGDRNTLLIGGDANNESGALYAVPVTRDPGGHITGFGGMATRFADAAFNDGGVTYGPGGVLFLARWPSNELGQTKPGSTITDKVIDMDALGVPRSLAALAFVPAGYPGAGRVKLSAWSGGQWYDAAVTPDGNGTYDLLGVTEVPDSQLHGGPEGYVYVPLGSPHFPKPSLLVSEYSAGNVAAYEVDARGNPVVATRRTVISELDGAEGAFIDPVTGDFLFSTFGGGDRVIAVRGFATPSPPAPPPPPPPADPFVELPANDLAFVCDTRKIAIQFLERQGKVAKAEGFAASSLIGQRLTLATVGNAKGKVKGRTAKTVVRPDGSFVGKIKLPRRAAAMRKVSIVARVGEERSRNVKLIRRARISRARSADGRTMLRGKVRTRKAKRRPKLTVRRRTACKGQKQWEKVATGKQKRNGTFKVSFDNPEGTVGSIFQVKTKYARKRGAKAKHSIVTWAVAVDLG